MLQGFTEYIDNIVKDKKVLSVGCAGYGEAGTLSKQFQRIKGKASKIYGLDNNEEFILKCNKENNLFYGNLNNFSWFDGLPLDFEIIIMTEVLEHIENPVATLRYIRHEKPENCTLLISVPNKESIGRCILSMLNTKMFYFQDRHHLCVFNKTTIRNCCKKAGLEILEINPYFHRKYYGLCCLSALASGFFVLCK